MCRSIENASVAEEDFGQVESYLFLSRQFSVYFTAYCVSNDLIVTLKLCLSLCKRCIGFVWNVSLCKMMIQVAKGVLEMYNFERVLRYRT